MERRKRTRQKTHQAVYFACTDSNGGLAVQDTAVVLNINENGLLLESAHNLAGTRDIRIMASDDNRKAVEVSGAVVYSITVAADQFNTGIAFNDTVDTISEFVAVITRKHP